MLDQSYGELADELILITVTGSLSAIAMLTCLTLLGNCVSRVSIQVEPIARKTLYHCQLTFIALECPIMGSSLSLRLDLAPQTLCHGESTETSNDPVKGLTSLSAHF